MASRSKSIVSGANATPFLSAGAHARCYPLCAPLRIFWTIPDLGRGRTRDMSEKHYREQWSNDNGAGSELANAARSGGKQA